MRIQVVIEYDLAEFDVRSQTCNFYEAERHLMDSFAAIEAGSMVRLRVHGYRPSRDYLGFTMREDIWLQIIADDPAVAREWRNVYEPRS